MHNFRGCALASRTSCLLDQCQKGFARLTDVMGSGPSHYPRRGALSLLFLAIRLRFTIGGLSRLLLVHVDEYSLFRSLRVHQGTHTTHMQRTSARPHTSQGAHVHPMSVACRYCWTAGSLAQFPPSTPIPPARGASSSLLSQKPEPRGVGHPHGPSVRPHAPARQPARPGN